MRYRKLEEQTLSDILDALDDFENDDDIEIPPSPPRPAKLIPFQQVHFVAQQRLILTSLLQIMLRRLHRSGKNPQDLHLRLKNLAQVSSLPQN